MKQKILRMLSFFFALLLFSDGFFWISPGRAAQGDITTYAGGAVADGLSATQAFFNSMQDAAFDSAGNLYAADSGNRRVRKVDALTGIVSTVAGGTFGFSGDGGPATSAAFSTAISIDFDAADHLYILDSGNRRVRKVDAATGIVTTVAGNGTFGFSGDGGLATSAAIAPEGIDVDAAGNIYIADRNNHRVRKVDAATGIITTVAGNGTGAFAGDGGLATSASLFLPNNVFVDSTGNIFIADTTNHRIRKVDAGTGIMSTVAGNGTGTFAGDGGLATSASLSAPEGIFVDALGNLYIADTGNRRVRRVDVGTGNISTFAGNGGFTFSGDGGLATAAGFTGPNDVLADASGNIHVVNYDPGTIYYQRVRKIDSGTGVITTVLGGGTGNGVVATQTGFFSPNGFDFDSAGNLYIGDSGNYNVRKVDLNTNIVSMYAGTGENSSTGDGGLATSATIQGPRSILFDASDNLYIVHSVYIRRVDGATGIMSTIAGTGSQPSFGNPFFGDGGLATAAPVDSLDIAIDSNGDLYIAELFSTIRKIDVSTGIITTVAGIGGFSFSGDGGLATAAGMNQPNAIVFDADDNLIIADTFNHRIRKVDAVTGIITTIAGTGVGNSTGDGGLATVAALCRPFDLVFDAAGHLFIGESACGGSTGNRVRRIDALTGIISTVAGTGATGFSVDGIPATTASISQPEDLAMDSLGNLYLRDGGGGLSRIRMVEGLGQFPAVCGNSVVEVPEVCDDGEATDAGTCNMSCSALTSCGDGTVQSPNGNAETETCDDGNVLNGDGCSSVCLVEGGGRRRTQGDADQALGGEGQVSPSAGSLSEGSLAEAVHQAAPEEAPTISSPLVALQQLFAWMDPTDYELTVRSSEARETFQFVFSLKKTLKTLALVTGYSDGYTYKKPAQESLLDVAQLMKAIMISFSECFSPAQMERALRHDFAENVYWWAGYWHFLDPLMQRFFGENYLLWIPLKDLNVLEVLEVFLMDYCAQK